MRKFIPVWGLAFTAILFMTWLGWGWWGYGVAGDYSLDLSEAIRLHAGQVPYHDFIPTYGALVMLLLAPFFSFGEHTFTLIWLATSLLVASQCGMMVGLFRGTQSRFFLVFAALLFVFAVAFKPSNSCFLMGYSTSGVFSAWLWTLFLLAISRSPGGNGLSAFALGLQPFTKMDMGLLSVLVLLFILFRNLLHGKWKDASRFLLLFALPGVVILGLLLFLGARPDLLYGSTAEAFGQAGYVRDYILGRRLAGLALMGGVLGICRIIPSFDCRYQRWIPWMPLLFAAFFAIASLTDSVRLVFWGSFHDLLVLNYFWAGVWVFVAANLGAQMIKSRSLADLRRTFDDGRMVVLLLGGVGLFRCALSGWFPLNYYQPALLLLAFSIFVLPEAVAPGMTRLFLTIGVGACVISSISAMAPGNNLTPFQTPYGWVRLDSETEPIPLFEKLRDNPSPGGLLCTYMPPAYLLTGREPSGIYTYWNRLSATGKYRQEREKLALDLFQKSPPRFVLLEKERATFAPHFGTDFGLEIQSWISQSYSPIDHFQNSKGGEWVLTQRKK